MKLAYNMLRVILLTTFTLTATRQLDPVIDQLSIFHNKTQGSIGIITTSAGAPIDVRDAGSTLNTNLFSNAFFMDSLNSFIREKIPERIVHAKGTGAFGYFETTHNISHICKAKLFSKIGKRTPLVARFSVGVVGQGGPDTTQTVMGFAVKFYTKQGNFDIVGLNTPMFSLKDPSIFVNFIHVMKKNPATNLQDVNMLWDFITLHPESIYMFMMMLGERSVHDGYRHTPGYSIHTYEVYNESGAKSFVRFHFIPTAGIKYLNLTEAADIGASNPDYFTEDLYRAIAFEKFPRWNLSLQILSPEDVKNATFDVFDTSKILPEDQYPLHPVGQMVLNRNPKNYFAEIEQLALNPANLVPGILGSPDKVFEARLMFYRHAQAYRLGANFNKIPVNCPYRRQVLTYNRDGVPPVDGNEFDAPNYYPNTFNGPIPYVDKNRPPPLQIYQDEPNNFEQAKQLYLNQWSYQERNSFVLAIIKTLCFATNFLQERAVEVFGKIHPDLSHRVAQALEHHQCKR